MSDFKIEVNDTKEGIIMKKNYNYFADSLICIETYTHGSTQCLRRFLIPEMSLFIWNCLSLLSIFIAELFGSRQVLLVHYKVENCFCPHF